MVSKDVYLVWFLQYVDVQSNQARSETTKDEDMSNQILDREFAPSLKVLWVQVKQANSRHFKVPSKLQATSFLFGTCVRWWLISSDPRIKNSQMACSRLVVIYRPSHGLQAVRGGVRVICRIRPFVEDDVWCSDQSRAKHVAFPKEVGKWQKTMFSLCSCVQTNPPINYAIDS